MIFHKTALKDAYVIELNKLTDERGFFARAWCKEEFDENQLSSNVVQANISHNKLKGTIRGMHYQVAPYEEAKLIRCIKGSIFDVIIDLRQDSPTFEQWLAFELTENNFKMLYVPQGFAHGFQTMENDTNVFYQVTQYYTPRCENGLRYNDPYFNIKWPLRATVVSEKDRTWENYNQKHADKISDL
ncbi:MAG: dTDP-4-dehydrorhamnose 3,5-epimerase [Candidatus Lokiarchaeota archaeon]|nr:dTDP-4-dehydrorhamnose 3,5-epimerase [Candidatus Lokiarchaeota archaeon]